MSEQLFPWILSFVILLIIFLSVSALLRSISKDADAVDKESNEAN